jgi:excisionase family DNA binding protein
VSDSDFFSFDKALDKLSLDEDDLKRLISAGEIRAFRDGSKMRLRAEDVDRVANDLGAVDESDAGEVLEVEEVGFDGDDGMVTTQLSEEDTLLDDGFDLEEVEMEEEAAPAARSARSSGRASAGRAAAAAPAAETEAESTGMLFATILTTAVLVYGVAFVFAALDARSTGLTDAVVEKFAE